MEARVAAVRQERVRMAAQLEARGWKVQANQGNFLWIRADDRLLAGLIDASDGASWFTVVLELAFPETAPVEAAEGTKQSVLID